MWRTILTLSLLITIGTKPVENIAPKPEPETHRKKADEEENVLIKNLGSKEIVKHKDEPKPEKVEAEKPKLEGIKVLGKINLEKEPKKQPEEIVVPAVVAPEEKKVALPD